MGENSDITKVRPHMPRADRIPHKNSTSAIWGRLNALNWLREQESTVRNSYFSSEPCLMTFYNSEGIWKNRHKTGPISPNHTKNGYIKENVYCLTILRNFRNFEIWNSGSSLVIAHEISSNGLRFYGIMMFFPPIPLNLDEEAWLSKGTLQIWFSLHVRPLCKSGSQPYIGHHGPELRLMKKQLRE